MEKQKWWQFYLILAVIALTLYNILPTIFYYAHPLRAPIDQPRADKVADAIISRVNKLEGDSVDWLHSFNHLLHLKPTQIALHPEDPRLISVVFNSQSDVERFKRFLPQAGELIPFPPSQVSLFAGGNETKPYEAIVMRRLGVHFSPEDRDHVFRFTPKRNEDGSLAPLYRDWIYERVAIAAQTLGGESLPALQLALLSANPTDSRYDDTALALAKEMVDVVDTLGIDSPLTRRYFASFGQSLDQKEPFSLQPFIVKAEQLKVKLTGQIEALKQGQESSSDIDSEQALSVAESHLIALNKALKIMRQHSDAFRRQNIAPPVMTAQAAVDALRTAESSVDARDPLQRLSLKGYNPWIQALAIDWNSNEVRFELYSDVEALIKQIPGTEGESYTKEKLQQLVINQVALAGRQSQEDIRPVGDAFAFDLHELKDPQSFLLLDLGALARRQSTHLIDQLGKQWSPEQIDLQRSQYPLLTYDTYEKLSPEDQKLGIVLYAPSMTKQPPPAGFSASSLYVIAKGLGTLQEKHRLTANTAGSQQFQKEINELAAFLQRYGFIGYSGQTPGIDPAYSRDYIFELDDAYGSLLKATREAFYIKGGRGFAALDFTDVEQRILAQNRIADRSQEDLLKWKEEYLAAQVDLNAASHYLVPAPTANPYWQNFKTSFSKYFNGDDRKVLKWGLDLSGGKTVRIGLVDQHNRPVTSPEDLRQAENELYARINKMGVSERTIRIENHSLVLDFPGSQGMSAAELIKASAMYFHIVNEKFAPGNAQLRDAVNHFLQEVWNEAIVTNRKDLQSINEIAWRHLGGSWVEGGEGRPRSEQARLLYENGLRLASPKAERGHGFDDSLSMIGLLRGTSFTDWDNQSHPLIVLFNNYALEGSSLDNVQVGYDPSQGNVLSFGIKRSYEGQRQGSPRDDFYTWTSQFAEDQIQGTPKEQYRHGRGWRMAVALNGEIISSPELKAALRDGGTISGRFSQREINQLAADLKAGSLSFTPKILSEQNVSAELGQEERSKGIYASIIALIAVVSAMVGYYHFAGVVASVAVLFNILIMWGVLQNLDAALTLPGIAGIVLTIGMAVDANVLVFERIREEFKLSKRISLSIQAGYRKAFSAIVDSNITTILAALILIQFDSGPIRGFAVTLIIGILSSMFTALFMTRYYFAGWVQNTKHTALSMAQFFDRPHFDFLSRTRTAVIASVILALVGMASFAAQSRTLFGMDFTGGYSLIVDVADKPDTDYRAAATAALLDEGATANDIQVRQLSRPSQLRIQMGMSMEEKGHPFYLMPEQLEGTAFAYPYASNPRITWVVDALARHGLEVAPSQLPTLDSQWTIISGQFSDAMRNQALMGLFLALLMILVYITLRFEFKFAVGAVIGLAHDLVLTIGFIAFLHWLGLPLQIDMQIIGALMTIIGYSLNDTIIVFDRIREDQQVLRRMSFKEIINHALNVTLSRTVMTSGTTLLVLVTLVLFGGQSIFAFALVMTIGVLIGTFSSLFIAGPVLLYFHEKEAGTALTTRNVH